MKKQEIIAFIVGLVIGGLMMQFTIPHHMHLDEDDTHPVGYADDEDEVHVHSDFVVYLDGERIDLSADKYQSTSAQILHAHIHLHDNNDEVIHRHDRGITLKDFFGSLGFSLTDNSITTDEGVTYESGEVNELMVFVNDERIDNPTDYVNEEEDQILVYFGDKNDNETIRNLLLEITDKSCIYSGTCPERGTAPPESCGLTCEL